MKYHELEVRSPNTVAGTSSVVHFITEDSALHGMTQEYVKTLTPSQFQVVVTMTGLDSRYQTEISAMKKYRPAMIEFDKLFKGVMRLDKKNRAFVDFLSLSDVVDMDPEKLAAGLAQRAEEQRSKSGAPTVADGEVHVCFGCFHRAPADPLKPVCVFCQRVRWVLEEAGVAFVSHRIDLSDKPNWFLNLNGCGLTPFAHVGGKWIGESEDILDALQAQHPSIHALLSRPCALPADVAEGGALRAEFHALLETTPGSDEAEDALEDWLELLAPINSHLIFNGPFLCGEELGRVDFTLGCSLFEMLLKATVWYGFDVDECAAVDIYLKRLEKRAAWKSGVIDTHMHLVWSVDVMRSMPAERQKLSRAALDTMLEKSEGLKTKGKKVNICL
jgi:glutathione S-transferase